MFLFTSSSFGELSRQEDLESSYRSYGTMGVFRKRFRYLVCVYMREFVSPFFSELIQFYCIQVSYFSLTWYWQLVLRSIILEGIYQIHLWGNFIWRLSVVQSLGVLVWVRCQVYGWPWLQRMEKGTYQFWSCMMLHALFLLTCFEYSRVDFMLGSESAKKQNRIHTPTMGSYLRGPRKTLIRYFLSVNLKEKFPANRIISGRRCHSIFEDLQRCLIWSLFGAGCEYFTSTKLAKL